MAVRHQPRWTAARPSGAATARRPRRAGELAERFPLDRDAVERAGELAARLEFDLTEDLGYRYRISPRRGEPRSGSSRARLRPRLRERYGDADGLKRRARQRLDEELKLIDELGLAGFFLLHWEVLELARECALEVRGGSRARNVLPPGRGRGSRSARSSAT